MGRGTYRLPALGKFSVFTALHEIQTRSSDENSVYLSVCLSNACFVTEWKKDRSRFLYHTKDHLAQFSEKIVGRGNPL